MNQSKVTSTNDSIQLKNTLYDQLAKCIENQWGDSRSHQHTYCKLVLGYVFVFIGAGLFLYEQKKELHDGKFGVLGCVIAYWLLQVASFMYSRFVENNETFVGYIYQGNDHVGTLNVSTAMQPHSPTYQIPCLYSDSKTRKHAQGELKSSVSSCFTEDGTFVAFEFDDFIKSSVELVAKRQHRD
ncbi:signal peptidase complex subunit 2 [Absidia repens]|uniref:Signal peptidase complex subunit 2 n=1 Tax=Absidia repens TaxID=90262 RepID=A0A1X2I3G4_9FUNG|nr:signal peptidase complex subunit 2 [Absidia repens]